MRFVHVALVAGAASLALLVACTGGDAGDDGGAGGEGPERDGRAGGHVGRVATGIDPDALVGETDTDLAHWDEGTPWEQPDGLATQRAYGGDIWSTVAGYPQAMNGCATVQRRVSWRSVEGPLFAGLTDYPSYGEQETFATPDAPVDGVASDGWVDVEAAAPATEGELVMNGCEQPVFRTTETNVLVDYAIEVTEHTPAV